MKSPSRIPLAAALVLYVLFRAWVVLTNFDGVAVPVYEVPGMGNHAWSLVEGSEGVPWHYYYDNAGGQLLTGYLAAPLYALFGASYGVLKLVPFLLGIGLLLLVWRFLRVNVGYRAAVLGVFAFALAPPTLSKYSLLAKGNHFEGLFFLFLPVVLYFEAVRRRAPSSALLEPSPEPGEGEASGSSAKGWLIAAGVAAGLAVSVYLGSILTLALLGLTGLSLGVRQGLRDLRYVVPGAAVGLLPFFMVQRATSGRAFDFAERFTQPDPHQSASGMWDEARALVLETLPEGACFESLGFLPAAVGEWSLLLAIAVSSLVVLSVGFKRRPDGSAEDRRRGAAARLCVLYLPLVLGVIAVGVLKIRVKVAPVEILGVRYLVSFYFYALLAIAIAVDHLLNRRPAKGLGRAGMGALGMGLSGMLALSWVFLLPMGSTDFGNASDAVRYPGTFFRNYGGLFHRDAVRDPSTGRFSLDHEHIQRVATAFDGVKREDMLFSVGNSLAYVALSPGLDPKTGQVLASDPDLPLVLAGFPLEDRAALARGFGAHLRTRLSAGAQQPKVLQRWLEEAFASGEYREMVAQGLGMSLEYPLRRRWSTELRSTENALRVVPADLRPSVRRGQARDLLVRRRIGLEGAESSIQELLAGIGPPEEREAVEAALKGLP